MSRAMSAAQILTQLKEWGVNYRAYKEGWATHNRAGHGEYGDMHGFIIHHTGSDSDQREYVWNGSTSLPGPLCHFYIDAAGIVWLIGWGRTNHAGGGDPAVFRHVVNEDYSGVLKPQYHEGKSGAVDGNAHFYGVEIGYSGTHGMNAKQYSSLLKLAAAVCDFHGWTQKSCIAHGEWSDWKWDPGYAPGRMMDMNAVRGDIRDVLKKLDRNADGDTADAGEPGYVAPKPVPAPVPPKTVELRLAALELRVTELEKKVGE